MNEKINIWFIVSILLFIILCGCIFAGLYYYFDTSKRNRQLSKDYSELNQELSKLNSENEQGNKQLKEVEQKFKEYKSGAEAEIEQLGKNLVQAGEIISRLENERNQIQGTTGEIQQAAEGIRRVLDQITGIQSD